MSNEYGPDYIGYYKHLVADLLSLEEDSLSSGVDSKASVGTCSEGGVEGFCCHDRGRNGSNKGGLISLFSRGIGEGLPELKKERLKAVLDESAISINREVNEVLDHIIAVFQIESDLREKYFQSYYSNEADEDITEPLCGGKRKASSPISNNSTSDGTPNSESLRQVYQSIQAQGNGEICSEAVEKYSIEICSKLGKMEQDLEEYLNAVVSHSRPMTPAEKNNLGRLIKKLPNKALDRVVELIQLRNLSSTNLSDDIFVNLQEQDNTTLWRLYYYVDTVIKANKL